MTVMSVAENEEIAEQLIVSYLEDPLPSDAWFGLTEQSTRQDFAILRVPYHSKEGGH
jgi:hypothetical protein